MPIGHSNNGKAADYVQRGSILLAKNGIACLAYDPIGQGERKQLIDEAGKSLIPSSTNEHTLIGVGALLVGQSTATYRIWDGIRSLDYLASRPEIDATKLGCTGCSGGGTLTSYLMALDDRIVCAAPSCYITSLERLFATIGPQDAEQNITGQVALGIEHADYLTMRAPRPTLLATATRDFFDIKGSWVTFREATQIYGLMGHSERVSLVEYNTTHGYPKPQREAIVRWMSRWLLNKDVAIEELAFAIAKDADLQCTRSGQVLEDFKGKSAFHLNVEMEQKVARSRPVRLAKQSHDQRLAEVRRLIGLPDKVQPARVVAADKELYRHGKLSYLKIALETEPGIRVPALVFPVKLAKATVVYVHGLGKTADLDAIAKLVDAGNTVMAVDLRGFGETSPGTPNAKPTPFGNDFTVSFLSFHLNRPLLGQRVYDLLSVIEHLNAQVMKTPIHVVGVQSAGPIVLHAAALEPRIALATLENSVLSWAAVVRSPINYNQLTNVVPGALKSYDLPDLATLVAPRPLTIRNPWNPKWEPISQAVLDESYANAISAFRTTGGKLTLVATK
jgi:cephalosporin-C deacetylase-like acetyl esterase